MAEITVIVEPNQEKRILKAFHRGKGCKINIQKTNEDIGDHPLKGTLLLNSNQLKRYEKASNGKLSLSFKHSDLKNNMRTKGGFLPLLAAVLAPVLGGVAGGLIEKEIAGSGIEYPKVVWCKKTGAFEVKPTKDGNGLRLSPWQQNRPSGFALYLSHYPHHNGTGINSKDELKNLSHQQK